jgi:hypothetical protein
LDACNSCFVRLSLLGGVFAFDLIQRLELTSELETIATLAAVDPNISPEAEDVHEVPDTHTHALLLAKMCDVKL